MVDADDDRDDKDEPEDEADLIKDAKARFQVAEETWAKNRQNALSPVRKSSGPSRSGASASWTAGPA
jgi:hypothetical protein